MVFIPNITPTLETPRLLLRPLQLSDAAQAQPLFSKWEIVRHLTNKVPWPYPPDGAHAFYRDVALPAVQRGDAWHWTLRLKEEPERLIGGICLMKSEDENRGFWLGLPWQGRGLMTEACLPVTDFWFDTLGFKKLRVPKAKENEPSRRISVSEGMRLVAAEERDYVCGRRLSEIWELTADQWRARQNPNAGPKPA